MDFDKDNNYKTRVTGLPNYLFLSYEMLLVVTLSNNHSECFDYKEFMRPRFGPSHWGQGCRVLRRTRLWNSGNTCPADGDVEGAPMGGNGASLKGIHCSSAITCLFAPTCTAEGQGWGP